MLNPSEKIFEALPKNQFNYEFILKTFFNLKEGLELRMENLQKSIVKTRAEVDEGRYPYMNCHIWIRKKFYSIITIRGDPYQKKSRNFFLIHI